MASITFKENPINTCGELPAVGSTPPDFNLVKTDLSEISLSTLAGKRVVFNIFPSLDTPVCASSVRRFNVEAAKLDNTLVLNVSADLPFALKRFCGSEGIENAEAASTFRGSLAKDWGVEITDSVLAGLCSRAVVILDESGKVIYTEQVPEITQEPDYDKALAAL